MRHVRPDVQDAVFKLARQIPAGQVASYGMIASLLPGVTARMVGHAMRGAGAVNGIVDVPWQRVINASGGLSAHDGSLEQQSLLISEGIEFSGAGKIKWQNYRWQGPDDIWLEENSIGPDKLIEIMGDWPR